jgi:hypothetical protein
LLRCYRRSHFGLDITDLMTPRRSAEMTFPVHHLAYLVGATSYHSQRLAELYAQISYRYSRIIQRFPAGHSDMGGFQNQTEPYYEFDALISAARRSYDSTRYLLWHKFGQERGSSTPRSLEALLKIPLEMPDVLRRRLTESWETFGRSLTHYRDCIHHNIPVDYGLATATMKRHQTRCWMTFMRIPDNPEAKSKRKYTFALGRDALTYGWGSLTRCSP